MDEVKNILSHLTGRDHLAVSLLYGAGLRVSELLRLRVNANKEFAWQYVFPAQRLYNGPLSERTIRYHLHESAIQKAIREAVLKSGIRKKVSSHTFRHFSRFLRDYTSAGERL